MTRGRIPSMASRPVLRSNVGAREKLVDLEPEPYDSGEWTIDDDVHLAWELHRAGDLPGNGPDPDQETREMLDEYAEMHRAGDTLLRDYQSGGTLLAEILAPLSEVIRTHGGAYQPFGPSGYDDDYDWGDVTTNGEDGSP
jgi:hypothetical protein